MQTGTPRAAKGATRWPGPQPDGNTLLSNGWSLHPAGRQLPLGHFPVNIAMHPSQPWAAVLHCGFRNHEIVIIDLKHQEVASRVTVPQAFYGITFDTAGERLFASGAEFEVVHEYDFADGKLSNHREIRIADQKAKQIPAGLACSPDGKMLYVACAWGSSLARVSLDKPEQIDRLQFEKDSYPYAIVPSRDGRRLFVSLWGKSTVAVVDAQAWKVISEWPIKKALAERSRPSILVAAADSHPTEMVLSPDDKLLYVACANLNDVFVLSTIDGESQEEMTISMWPNSPNGSIPSSLALSADGKVLLVANSGNNNLAAFDVSRRCKSRSLGFIPTGWYPTSVRFGLAEKPDLGEEIYVASGKGLGSRANPNGPGRPEPTRSEIKGKKTPDEYIGGLFNGTFGIIDPPSPEQMARYSQQARSCCPVANDRRIAAAPRGEGNPIRDGSPIRHCIYIIRENRTYDQVFGDVKEGNGDPRLCLFDRHITPNAHALAKQFVLLDNFYANAEVSAQGHEWSTAAYCSDFVEKTWPLSYRGKAPDKIGYPSEGKYPIAFPAVGYIWDRCKESKVTYRSYGEFIDNGAHAGEASHTNMKTLVGHFDPKYRGWDLDYPDAKRTDEFLAELAHFNKSYDMPRFIVLRLPNDHTHGTVRGKPTPAAMVAENDLALGRLVEGVSHSHLWQETAIFVVEDDSQNGSDHVDAHRTVALVISPYCRRGAVDSTLYATTSMLRTMELILGLQPMSQFDAAATPMYGCFQATLNLEPYVHVPAEVSLTAVNEAGAWGSEASAKLDFSHEDAADETTLNQVIWHSVRGADSAMPPPVHAAFVRTRSAAPAGDDDD
ncbi:MAG TPA: alkaline phosphatase family protein [Pirellulales bacterium]|nr:alkaline phosphatase family protein [Pirellulales bacterium]